MIRHDLLHAIKRDRQHISFIYPYYGAYSIAEIPPTIEAVLGHEPERARLPFTDEIGRYERVLFFFVDGLGFDHFIDYKPWLPFFDKLATRGTVYPLTSVFPSTTPAALTTFHTGMTPQEHGLPEWAVYFEEFGEVIEPLPFRAHMTGAPDSLKDVGGNSAMLFKGQTVYERLAERGVASYVLISEHYADSTYSTTTQCGAHKVPFSTPEDLFNKLVGLLNEDTGPAYFFLYWNAVDVAEHMHGPKSREHIRALDELSHLLTDSLMARLEPEKVAKTLFMMSSDHGQTSILNEDIIYLNEFPELEKSYRVSRLGKPIPPTGAPHDVFLHVRDEEVPAMLGHLSVALAGKAEVLTIEEALTRNLFGLNQVNRSFRERIGNILILPYEGYHVWYRFTPEGRFPHLGIHGGLSQEEMIVPFAVAPFTSLLR